MKQNDIVSDNFISNNMIINLDMFSSFMKDWISSNVECSLTITMKCDGIRVRDPEAREHFCQPF